MPLITVKLMENAYTANQRHELIRKFTDTIVAVKGESMGSVTWVVIEEVKSGEWGVGGVPVTTDDVKALATGNPKG